MNAAAKAGWTSCKYIDDRARDQCLHELTEPPTVALALGRDGLCNRLTDDGEPEDAERDDQCSLLGIAIEPDDEPAHDRAAHDPDNGTEQRTFNGTCAARFG